MLQSCAVCAAVTAAVLMPLSTPAAAAAFEFGRAVSELSVLISGPPIKDANALLRYALPIDNKAIKEVQKSLEDITGEMKVPGEKALGSVGQVWVCFESLLNPGQELFSPGIFCDDFQLVMVTL
jgi:hypothetical protein